jgi:type III restriction enzyme
VQETTNGGSDIEKLRFETEGTKVRFGDAHVKSLRVSYASGDNAQLLIEPGAFGGTP